MSELMQWIHLGSLADNSELPYVIVIIVMLAMFIVWMWLQNRALYRNAGNLDAVREDAEKILNQAREEAEQLRKNARMEARWF